MNKIELFLSELKKLLELDSISLDFELDKCELWDSLTIVSTLALFDQIFKKRVKGEELSSCKTIYALLELAER